MATPDDAKRLLGIAKTLQNQVNDAGMGVAESKGDSPVAKERTLLDRFDEVVTDAELSLTCRQLFVDEHYARSVEEAFKHLNNAVKEKSGLSNVDGETLMQQAFTPNNPKLRLNRMRTPTDDNEQRGYMNLYSGAMTAIRNPRAHEHRIQDDPETALELLTLCNHLMGRLGTSIKTRRRKKSR